MRRGVAESCARRKATPRDRALVVNDQATDLALEGRVVAAIRGFEQALALDPECEAARRNLEFLRQDEDARLLVECGTGEPPPVTATPEPGPPGGRIAILSLLFNWPARGGGVMHTVELGEALGRAGYEVEHFHARHDDWGIGRVDAPLPFPSYPVDLGDDAWSLSGLKCAFRRAVDQLMPDHVLIADAWNTKPHLADAVEGYRYSILLQAMETLCPLNNIRLLPHAGDVKQCHANRLAANWECLDCLGQFAATSGPLHRAERALSQVETNDYEGLLRRALRQAEAVFVCNPVIAGMVRRHARRVVVAPAAIDGRRFPWPHRRPRRRDKTRLFFAGAVEEPIKGFSVLLAACESLRQCRKDFELVATGEPAGVVNDHTRFIGWLGQEELAHELADADIVVVPSIAQESFGRVAAEAMGAGIPVVASRIGGLPTTVLDGKTGLLFEPRSANDLAAKLETLLANPWLRRRLGRAGRARFVREFTWEGVIERCFRPVLSGSRAGALEVDEPVAVGAI